MARGWQVTISLKDGQTRLTSLTVTLSASITTVSAAQTALDSLLTDFAGISDLGIQGAYLSVPLTVTTTTAENTSNYDEGAKMKILTTDGKNWSFRIPAPSKTSGVFDYIVSEKVDVSDAAIVAFFANYLAAGAFRFGDTSQQIMVPAGGIVSGVLEKA